MGMNDLEKILVLNEPIRAELVRGLLEAQGIQVMLSKEGAATAYGLTVGAFSEIEIFVRHAQVDAAKKIIDEYFLSADNKKEED